MVTIKDVAERAGVSIATVSSVLNRSRPVAAATRDRVLAACQELGYSSRKTAGGKNGKTRRILYFVPSVTNLVFSQLVHEVQAVLNQHNLDLVLFSNQVRQDTTRSYARTLTRQQVDGVLMTQTRSCGDIIAQACTERGIPLTVLIAPDGQYQVPSVLSDDEQGAYDAAVYLARHGHHSIGLAMVKGSAVHERRLAGYQRALQDLGLSSSVSRVIRCAGHDELDAYAHAKLHLEAHGCNFSALVCCNDFMAFGVMRFLREKGLEIPRDVSIVGCDDSIGRYLYPPLTSIAIPKAQLAKSAVHMLLEQMQGDRPEPKRIVFPQKLVVRNSVHIVAG